MGHHALAVVEVGEGLGVGAALGLGIVQAGAIAIGGLHQVLGRGHRGIVRHAGALAEDGGAHGAAGLVKVDLGQHFHQQRLAAQAVDGDAHGAALEQQRRDGDLLALVQTVGPGAQVVLAGLAQFRVGEADAQVAHLAGGILAGQEPLADAALGHGHQLLGADAVPQVVAHVGAAGTVHAGIHMRDGVGVVVAHPGFGGCVELLDGIYRFEAQARFELRFHDVVGHLDRAFGPGVAGAVGFVLHAEGIKQALDAVAGVGAALVPQ